jgi:hypothetical protein
MLASNGKVMVMTHVPMSRSAKKMILFVSNANIIWRTIYKDHKEDVTQGLIAKALQLPASTISSWKNGAPISNKLSDKIFQNARDKIKSDVKKSDDRLRCETALTEFEAGYGNYAETVYRTADRIQIKIETAQLILDDVVYRRHSLFPGMQYDDAGEADRTFRKYKGTYLLWVHRGERWFRCALRVRYVLDVNGQIVIRCKLNLPNQDYGEGYWEYDGFLAEKDYNVFWIFEKRQEKREDYFSFITSSKRKTATNIENPSALDDLGKPVLTFVGRYLTTDQNPQQSIVTEELFLQLQDDESKSADDLNRIMHKSAEIFEKDQCDAVNQVWAKLDTCSTA